MQGRSGVAEREVRVGICKRLQMWPLFLCLFCFAPEVSGRESGTAGRDTTGKVLEQVARVLEEQEAGSEEEERSTAMALEYFEQLLEHPLDINRTGRGGLEKLLLLSDFQIMSLLDYRAATGEIRSASELALLNGFDDDFVRLLNPFITFGSPEGGFRPHPGDDNRYTVKQFFRDCKSTLFFKGNRVLEADEMYTPVSREEFEKHPDSRYLGTPYYMQLKYKCIWAGKIQGGFTLENDAGERFFPSSGAPVDFCSFHIALTDLSHLKCLILGDFSARFGQGLTLWNSFSLQANQSPMGLYKRGIPFVPYTSSDENHFFRGIAASLSYGRLDVSMMFSYNRLDARIAGEEYTSIVSGGLHNTVGTWSTRKTMHEGMGGVTVSYLFDKLKIGTSFTAYGYDKANGRKAREYNQYQMYDGIWGNASVHFYGIAGKMKYFGELAFDYGGSCAALAGVVFPVNDAWEAGILARSYSKSYIAPHAGAYSTLSSCSNQQGILINGTGRISRDWQISAVLEGVRYPWMRYNVDAVSGLFKGSVKAVYTGRKLEGYIRLAGSYATYGSVGKLGVRLLAGIPLSRSMTIKLRGEGVFSGGFGGQAALDAEYKTSGGMFRIQFRGACFDCPAWDTRLYLYENDLPYTYNSRLLYGRGWCGYLLVRIRPVSRMNLYAKLETIQYFAGEKKPVSKIKIGTEIKF